MRADETYRSIPRMALLNAQRFGDELAVIDDEVRLSFLAVRQQMVQIARALLADGIEPGDRVALWAPNSAGWIAAALGIMATGARLVPLNTRFKGSEAAFILERSAARTLICVDGFLGLDYVSMLRDEGRPLSALERTVILEGAGKDGADSWDEFLARGVGVDESEVLGRIEAIGPDDPSDVMFTSGTTGHPKGVMLRHGASLRGYEAYNEGYCLGRGDRTMIVTPFFHCFGYKAGWMLALMTGATSVPMRVFEPGAALAMIEEQQITHTAGPPTMFWAMLDHPSRPQRDISSLRVAVASAAYVPVDLIRRMQDELGLDWAMTGYGLTEAHAIVAITHPDDPPDVVANWSGRPLRGVDVRIVDDEGHDVPLGERGELLVRGFGVMDGYFDDPEGTAAVIDAEGWLHTGDIAYADEEGFLKVCDRKKDMYLMGGFNVAPAEVEGMLVDWEKIAGAAVVGLPDPQWGEVGAAFVVPAAGVTLTADEVVAWARVHMANFKVPRRVEIVDSLPLNATGKVIKSELRDRLAATRPDRT